MPDIDLRAAHAAGNQIEGIDADAALKRHVLVMREPGLNDEWETSNESRESSS